MISQTVGSMLPMPPRESSSSSAAFPDSSAKPPYSAIHTPLTIAAPVGSPSSPT